MKVKIKKLHENAVVPFKTYLSDFCYDVVAVSEEEVAHNVWKYGLGIALQIDRDSDIYSSNITLSKGGFITKIVTDGYGSTEDAYGLKMITNNANVNLSIDFRPRSSVWETGMVLSNCEGTIDEYYTGEISAVFYHVMPNMPRYKVGDRIGQIKIGATFPIEFEEVEELSETERGACGYGSTGK